MNPSSFPEANGTLGPPLGVPEAAPDQSGYGVASLIVWRGTFTDGDPGVISCWKPTADDLERLNRGEPLWMCCVARSIPPTILTTDCPFDRP